MRLPRGATGFRDNGREPPPAVPFRGYLGLCHSAARVAGWRVTGSVPAGVTPNFHRVGVARHGAERVVACHAQLPMLAIAEPVPDAGASLAFTREPRLAEALAAVSGFRVLTSTELAAPVDAADLTDLDETEISGIRYWAPETLGELLFNWWD